MTETIRNHLLDVGCPEDSAAVVAQLCGDGRLDDALRQMRILRCDLMEKLHQSQRKVDCLDHLIRQTEKEIRINNTEKGAS